MDGHVQTVAGGMGSTLSPAGRYRRECSCGFAGEWGSLNDALLAFCPEAGPECTCDLGGPRHNGDCPAHPDSMERNQPAAPGPTKEGR